jgi:hypothetical protein
VAEGDEQEAQGRNKGQLPDEDVVQQLLEKAVPAVMQGERV